MGSEAKTKPNSTPKLSLFSLPNQSPEPPGMLTPPLMPPASVPFLWEEAPGKPRTSNNKLKSATARCLELPPRLLTEAKITNIPSPTTVLEGPYILGRSSSYSSASFSFSRERGGQMLGHSKRENKERERVGGGFFGSWGKKNSKGNRDIVKGSFVISGSSSSLSSSTAVFVKDDEEDVNGGGGENTKVKITRFRRRGSFLSLSTTSSHSWASIYGTFKQVVPWRRSRKMKKEESSDLKILTV